jgi:hypothetical protein
MQGWIEPLALECKRFYAQFGIDGQMVVRLGAESAAEPITRAELQGDYIFSATGGAQDQAKMQEVERAVKAVELGAKLPPSPDGSVFNTQKAFIEIILPSLGQKNSADWFTQPPMPMGMPGMPLPAPAPGMEASPAETGAPAVEAGDGGLAFE